MNFDDSGKTIRDIRMKVYIDRKNLPNAAQYLQHVTRNHRHVPGCARPLPSLPLATTDVVSIVSLFRRLSRTSLTSRRAYSIKVTTLARTVGTSKFETQRKKGATGSSNGHAAINSPVTLKNILNTAFGSGRGKV